MGATAAAGRAAPEQRRGDLATWRHGIGSQKTSRKQWRKTDCLKKRHHLIYWLIIIFPSRTGVWVIYHGISPCQTHPKLWSVAAGASTLRADLAVAGANRICWDASSTGFLQCCSAARPRIRVPAGCRWNERRWDTSENPTIKYPQFLEMGYFKHPQPQWMFDCGFTRWQKEEDGNVRHSPRMQHGHSVSAKN